MTQESERSPIVLLAVFLGLGLGGGILYRLDSVRPYTPAAPSKPSAKTSAVRPYLTPHVEEIMARDNCEIEKQRCRKNGVCITCMICPWEGRNLLGSSFTKCKSPTDCIELTDNVAWEREKVDPGWCEGMPFQEDP